MKKGGAVDENHCGSTHRPAPASVYARNFSFSESLRSHISAALMLYRILREPTQEEQTERRPEVARKVSPPILTNRMSRKSRTHDTRNIETHISGRYPEPPTRHYSERSVLTPDWFPAGSAAFLILQIWCVGKNWPPHCTIYAVRRADKPSFLKRHGGQLAIALAEAGVGAFAKKLFDLVF
jgi:hypothetical protein